MQALHSTHDILQRRQTVSVVDMRGRQRCEVHIPYVSTMKIYIPCPAPPSGSLAARVEIALNVSALAQSAIGLMR